MLGHPTGRNWSILTNAHVTEDEATRNRRRYEKHLFDASGTIGRSRNELEGDLEETVGPLRPNVSGQEDTSVTARSERYETVVDGTSCNAKLRESADQSERVIGSEGTR